MSKSDHEIHQQSVKKFFPQSPPKHQKNISPTHTNTKEGGSFSAYGHYVCDVRHVHKHTHVRITTRMLYYTCHANFRFVSLCLSLSPITYNSYAHIVTYTRRAFNIVNVFLDHFNPKPTVENSKKIPIAVLRCSKFFCLSGFAIYTYVVLCFFIFVLWCFLF